MSSYLELSINGLTARFDRFINDTLPRIDATEESVSGVNYTASGVAVILAPSYDSFSLWNAEVICTRENYETLKLIYLESNYQIRNNGNYNILITDTTQLYEERGSRTRALAPDTTETARTFYVLYFAQFYGVMLAKPEFKLQGNGYVAQFTLQETDKTTP